MASEKTVNYTAEQTNKLVADYQGGATVEALASELGKTVRSVIAKLSRAGVYKAKVAQGSERVTKAQLINVITNRLELDAGVLASLEKADKGALEALAGALPQLN